jgi:hypothetical protein
MNKVVLMPGRKAQAVFSAGVLRIMITPKPGAGLDNEVAARPSSRKIAIALRH